MLLGLKNTQNSGIINKKGKGGNHEQATCRFDKT